MGGLPAAIAHSAGDERNMTEPSQKHESVSSSESTRCSQRCFRPTAQRSVENARSVGDGVWSMLLLGEKAMNESALEGLETASVDDRRRAGNHPSDYEPSLTDRAGRRELANMGALLQALHGLLVQRLHGVARPLSFAARKPDGLP